MGNQKDDQKTGEKLVRSTEPTTDSTALSDNDLEGVAGGAAPQCAIVNDGMTFVHESYYLSAEA